MSIRTNIPWHADAIAHVIQVIGHELDRMECSKTAKAERWYRSHESIRFSLPTDMGYIGIPELESEVAPFLEVQRMPSYPFKFKIYAPFKIEVSGFNEYIARRAEILT